MADTERKFPGWRGTTILSVRKNGKVVLAGDGQVSIGEGSSASEASIHR